MSLYDVEAEKSLLGCMIKENQVTSIVKSIVNENDFSVDEHRNIFSTFLRMFESKEVFNSKTVPSGCEDIATTLYVASTAHVKHYALRVSRSAKIRTLANISAKLFEECEEVDLTSEADTEHFMRTWQEKLVNATTIKKRIQSKKMSDVCSEVFQQLEENSKLKGSLRGCSMGIQSFDDICLGMRKSDTYIISARAGVGKTALMINALKGATQGGSKALVYSYEMKPSMLVQRMFMATAKINGTRMDNGELNEADMIKLSGAIEKLNPLPIWFEEKGNISDIRAACIEQHRTIGLDLLVVDHVGLVDSIGRSPNREREVAEISRGLKSIATDLNIPVLILAQLNRQSDPTQEPALSELRESGSLEQDASVVFMLWSSPDNEKNNEVQWKIAKNRHGASGRKGVLSFYRDIQYITDQTDGPLSRGKSMSDQTDRLAYGSSQRQGNWIKQGGI